MVKRPLVAVVDDDQSVRESLPDLLRSFGFDVRAFSSAEAFLASDSHEQTECLILDVAMPGMTGLDLQQELNRRQQRFPIVFITAQSGEAARAQALASGAVACLFKPFDEASILEAVNVALKRG
jgi:FixJ family two-component response regulator